MGLQDKLTAFKKDFVSKVPEAVVETVGRATAQLNASGQAERAVPLASTLPPFRLQNQDRQEVQLSNLLAKGPLVVSFFRGGWCPYCNLELEALSEVTPQIREIGADIVVITPQVPERSAEMRRVKKLEFDLLTDVGLKYADQLGLAFTMPDDLVEVYKGFKLDIPGYNGDDSWRLPLPTRLVLKSSGEIISRNVETDYTRRPEPEETLEVLRGLARL